MGLNELDDLGFSKTGLAGCEYEEKKWTRQYEQKTTEHVGTLLRPGQGLLATEANKSTRASKGA